MVKQNKFNKEYWNFPGGKIEDGETPEEACMREIEEETGLTVHIVRKIYEDPYRYAFLVEVLSGDLMKEQKLLDMAWVSEDELEKWDRVTSSILRALIND
jgi:8-oxo-dGTP diphosphatase